MTTTAPAHLTIDYVACDLRDGQTLVEWRRELDAERRAPRRARRPALRELCRRSVRGAP